MIEDDDDDDQSRAWNWLYHQIERLLRKHGKEDYLGRADFWVLDDNWGILSHKIHINNLELLKPAVIASLQRLLRDYSAWSIVIAVAVPGPGEAWPDMGLTIRRHEIIDGLQRRYFPPAYRHFHYPGSRPGTERD
jgi:hypothetical protein